MQTIQRCNVLLLCLVTWLPYRDFLLVNAAKADLEISTNGVSSRIVGGDIVNPRDSYPWFVRLTDREGRWAGCGGTLVTSEYVLTAAHCVFPNTNWKASGSAVQIGSVCPYERNNCGVDKEEINVEKIIAHEDFEGGGNNYDFALVKLQKQSTIKPLKMYVAARLFVRCSILNWSNFINSSIHFTT